MRSAESRVTTLCISACDPTRIVTTFLSEALVESVRVTPLQSDRTKRKTVTTRQMTKTVIPVDTLRTIRFRRLYLSGIAISPFWGQA